MRYRALSALAAASLISLLVLLRNDLRELARLARTYATFYPYLASHQEVLYRYPTSDAAADQSFRTELVPPIVHRILLGREQQALDGHYADSIASCHSVLQNWTHLEWNETGASAFIKEYYPELLSTYLRGLENYDRLNMLKYALLEVYGGVYLDLDVTCLQPLDELRNLPFLTVSAYPAGVDEAFVLSRRNHPLLRRLLESLENRSKQLRMPYISRLLSAGSVFFNNDWMSYMLSFARKRNGNLSACDSTHILADADGRIETHVLHGGLSTPLFRSRDANASYGWDTTGMFMVSRHWVYFIIMMALGAMATSLLLWRISRRRRCAWTARVPDGNKIKKIEDFRYPMAPKLDDKC